MTYRFTAEVPLRWVDVDSEGVVNHAVYLSLIEQARFLYCDQLGLLPDRRVSFLLKEATMRFLRPGLVGMRTTVAARTVRLQDSSFVMAYEVRGDGEVLAEGEAVLVYVDGDRRKTSMPDTARAAISAYEGIPARSPRS